MRAQEIPAGTGSGFIWDDGGREFLRETSALMQTWIEMFLSQHTAMIASRIGRSQLIEKVYNRYT